MPVSPSSMSGICCLSMSDLLELCASSESIGQVKQDMQQYLTTGNSLSLQGCTFVLILFLEFCSSTCAFSSFFLLHIFSSGNRDNLKQVIRCYDSPVLFADLFHPVTPFSHESEHHDAKQTSLIIHLLLAFPTGKCFERN